MNKILLNLSLLSLSALAFGQSTNNSTCLSGIWQGIEYIKEPFPDVRSNYLVFYANKKLEFDVKTGMLKVFINGLQSQSSDSQGLFDKKTKIKELKSKGLYYTEILASDTNENSLDFSIDINFT